VKDIVLNDTHDGFSYVALGHGGIVGVGQKIIAVPWSEFRVEVKETAREAKPERTVPGIVTPEPSAYDFGYRESYLVLNTTSELLGKLVGIEGREWPDVATPLSIQESGKAVTEEAVPEAMMPESRAAEARRLFESRKVAGLIGLDVRPDKVLKPVAAMPRILESIAPPDLDIETFDYTGTDYTSTFGTIGEIRDLLVNTNNGRLIYGVVLLNKLKGYENESSIVPWSALRILPTEPRFARLSVPDTETLLAFRTSEIQHRMLANQGFAHGIFDAYDQQPQWETLGFVAPEPEPMTPSREPMKEPGAKPESPEGMYDR
jgi:hypothetical protein